METENKWRVKVYNYSDTLEWEDMGTGHVTMTFVERLQSLTITIHSEQDCSILLESKVLPDRAYQKQEETLIVWTEDDACDLALSFKDKEGCDELWERICEIQGQPSVSIARDTSDDGEMSPHFDDSSISIELPPCELGRLDDIFVLMTSVITLPIRREGLALAMEKENYIAKLLDLFHVCEDLDNVEGLHHLYKIFRTLFLVNVASLLSLMFQDDVITDVIGCLEYDPTKPRPVRHREYLANTAQHREVIPFNNPDLLSKIHQTYKVQYIQEVILPTPSLFEQNMMSALNAFILFNKAEIINSLQNDTHFLQEMFSQLADENTTEQRFRELSDLLREVCNFSIALEDKDRKDFFHKLCSHGFMDAVEGMLTCEDAVVVATVVDILHSIAEFNCSLLVEHVMQQAEAVEEDVHFINIVISLLIDGQFNEIDVQLVGLIKTLIDPESIMTDAAGTVQTIEKSLYVNYFYKHCMHRLMAPLMAHTTGSKVSKDTAHNAVLLSHTLDLLSHCVERHSYHIRNYIIDKNALARVLVLMTSMHGHLALAALRFCRRIIGLKDEFYHRYIVRNNLLAPIVTAFLDNGTRYNLINSAIIELFEFITQEKQFTLIGYVVDAFPMLEAVEYVDTFKKLKLRHEQELEHLENPPTSQAGIIYCGSLAGAQRFRRDARQVDEDEEAWFDEEEETVVAPSELLSSSSSSSSPPPGRPPPSSSSTPIPVSVSASSPFSLSSYSPRPPLARRIMSRTGFSDSKLPTISAALQSLADYDEDSDEENSEDEVPSPMKRQKLDGNT